MRLHAKEADNDVIAVPFLSSLIMQKLVDASERIEIRVQTSVVGFQEVTTSNDDLKLSSAAGRFRIALCRLKVSGYVLSH
jgi:hypothetical protein